MRAREPGGRGTSPAPWAQVKETHTAVVILLGDHAYKVKKPVDLGFLDFTTLEARRAVCEEEVELNRRLAPLVYEGVADVLGPDGKTCEHLVVMRRMPDERRLAALVRAGRPVEGQLRRIARMVASLHGGARHGPEIDREGGGAALRERWTASFRQVGKLPGVLDDELASEIERLALRFVDGREPLFAARVRRGRIVEGHGDLLTEDIFCLEEGPQILDCLEFDPRLRYLDGLDDAAFLAMDLERLGSPRLAELFLRWYTDFSGDPAPPSLWHHYVAYRAFVRAKVACVRHAQGGADAAWEARNLGELSLRHLRAGAAALILVGGLPGTGKSTLAAALAGHLGYTLLASDRVRKELAGITPDQPAGAPFGEGVYTSEWTERTYGELMSRARALLGFGESVILDASWTDEAHRAAAGRLARDAFADMVALRCTAMPEVTAERLSRRTGGASDADQAIAEVLRQRTAPWPESVEIDTGTSPRQALEQALVALGPRSEPTSWRFRRPSMEPD
ncbi:bifunctional aminoglycoside phosphotransferase/ATP-binding protein [Sphaerisporangium sp. TRM90804]|uniref:bifunctional aminoglycoside phosphotransferase/ATP-binding protein n=1 Tax=Sphaerisporangium sp. TRM90804 TaxID=3031113 RepID=UPI00244B48DA|nr:bifunctional aminoglycoside phosphotransferase/ATP-binding protein [Sphaerisporangium sp. TRM90804]MDH2430818.1 AAA family ATPase [Sphaerisporangium sp. TRM90804]